MRSIIENTIVKMLNEYMKIEGITQVELANKLGWSAQDLNDTLRKRKPIGKNRQAHISKKLEPFFDPLERALSGDNVRGIKEPQSPSYGLNDDDIEIARLISTSLTKEQKGTLKTFIKSIQKKI